MYINQNPTHMPHILKTLKPINKLENHLSTSSSPLPLDSSPEKAPFFAGNQLDLVPIAGNQLDLVSIKQPKPPKTA